MYPKNRKNCNFASMKEGMDKHTKEILIRYANQYENAEFITHDPCFFVHQVQGESNQETMGFIASWLSYGNRKQFMPKIHNILEWSQGEVYSWVKSGEFEKSIPTTDDCYYRLHSNKSVNDNLCVLRQILIEFGSLKTFISQNSIDALSAIRLLCGYYADKGISSIIPKNMASACKRICMYLRWMVRDNSPVDIGIWSDIIDRRTLIMPLDTHVIAMANQLGMLNSRTSSMKNALNLTHQMRQVFPDDPLKGDFALFGYGISHSNGGNSL